MDRIGTLSPFQVPSKIEQPSKFARWKHRIYEILTHEKTLVGLGTLAVSAIALGYLASTWPHNDPPNLPPLPEDDPPSLPVEPCFPPEIPTNVSNLEILPEQPTTIVPTPQVEAPAGRAWNSSFEELDPFEWAMVALGVGAFVVDCIIKRASRPASPGAERPIGRDHSNQRFSIGAISRVLNLGREDPFQDLDKWCREVQGKKHRLRCKAARRIRECYAQGAARLDLSRFKLTSLPVSFEKLDHLQELDLSWNELTSLPCGISNLRQLQKLEVQHNRLPFLPTEVGMLFNLKYLDVSYNKVCFLPYLNLLTDLRVLNASNNVMFYQTLLDFPELAILNLESNHLQSFPELNCSKLSFLNLAGNRIQSVPSNILNKLSERFTLQLSNNPISSLPVEVFDFPFSEIYIYNSSLSDHDLLNIENRINQPGYEGALFHGLQQMHMESEKDLNQLLDEVFFYSNERRPDLDQLITHPKNGKLRSFLDRLSLTIQYHEGGEFRKVLARKVVEYLKLAQRDFSYRKDFFAQMSNAAVKCGDRIALIIIHLGIAKKLQEANPDHLEELHRLLLHGVWIVQLLEDIGYEKIVSLREAKEDHDDVEIYLGYLLELKDEFQLPIDIDRMRFNHGLSEQDLELARKRVQAALDDPKEKYEFLVNHELWKRALERKAPEAYRKAMDHEDAMEALQALIPLTRSLLERDESEESTLSIGFSDLSSQMRGSGCSLYSQSQVYSHEAASSSLTHCVDSGLIPSNISSQSDASSSHTQEEVGISSSLALSTAASAQSVLPELDAWCCAAEGTAEYPSRIEAVRRIRDCQTNRSTTLRLNRLDLTSLPEQLQGFSHLRVLDISNNNIAAFPDWLKQLQLARLIRDQHMKN